MSRQLYKSTGKKSLFDEQFAVEKLSEIGNPLFAQEVSAVAPAKASYDLKKNVKARVSQTDGKTMAADDWDANNAKASQGKRFRKSTVCNVTPTDDGCVVTLESSINLPRDAASGLATGRRMHKPFSVFVKASDNAVSEVKSPRDLATGQSTGKGEQKPVGGGGAVKASFSDLSVTSAGKATFKEFTITKRCDGKTTEIRYPNGDCEIPLDDCPNGSCDLFCSWSWGATNTGSMTSGSGATSGRCAEGFSLEIEDGTCTAITKKDVMISSYDLAPGKKNNHKKGSSKNFFFYCFKIKIHSKNSSL